MSIAIMTAVWRRTDLGTSEKMVLLALADHANDDGVCHPSVTGLATKTSISDRGVQKIIARLVAAGFVRVQTGSARNGRNLYHISLPAEPDTPNPVHPEPRSPRTGFTTTPNPVHPDPEPGSPLTPNPVHPNHHLTTNEPPPPAAADLEEFDFDGFVARLCQAVGILGIVPVAWSGKRGRARIEAWLAHLTPDEVITRATESRRLHPEPPGTPQALDGFMSAAARQKQSTVTEAALLEGNARWINSDRSIPANLVSPQMAARMLELGLVTAERLAARGIQVAR